MRKLTCHKIVLVAMLLLCCALNYADAQTVTNFKKLNKADGISQYSVFCISEDKDGFIWFGTRDGLNKYDGYEFKIYRKKNDNKSIISNDIRVLYNDPLTKELWIGTLGGISVYKSKTDDFENFSQDPSNPNSLSSKDIRSIYRRSDGKLIIATSIGLSIFNDKTRKFSRIYLGQNENNNRLEALLEVNKNELWVATREGIFVLDKDYKISKLDSKFVFSKMNVTVLSKDKQGNIWIGTSSNGVYKYNINNNSVEEFSTKSGKYRINNDVIRSLLVDSKNRLWIGSFKGIDRYNILTGKLDKFEANFFNEDGLSDNSIRSIYEDKRGAIWIGTYFGGVNHIDEEYNKFENFNHNPYRNSVSNNIVSSFEEDDKGNVWIGTEGGGLDYYNTTTKQFINYNLQVGISDRVNGLNVKTLLYHKNILWIGTLNGGLINYNVITKKHKKIELKNNQNVNFSTGNVYGLMEDNDRIWIAIFGHGLNILDLKSNTITPVMPNAKKAKSLTSQFCRLVFKTKNGNIYVGTSTGLNLVSLDENRFPKSFENVLPNIKIISHLEDRKGNLWIGSENDGLFILENDKGAFKKIDLNENVSGRNIFGIIEDEAGYLWLSTNTGLSRMSPKDYTINNFDRSNGLINTEYNFHAYKKLKNQTVLFGGINGFTKFNPKDIKLNDHAPSLVFTSLIQNNVEVSIGDGSNIIESNINNTRTITFPYNQANFTIKFAALDFFNPSKNKYKYKLEGIDKDWNFTVGNPSATYTIQREGEYRFVVKGANNNNVWSKDERSVIIKVNPPFWKTWWAYLIYLISLGIALRLLLRYFKIRESFKLEQAYNKQQEDLHQLKVKFFTNIAHEFRTPLTLIIGPLEEVIRNAEKSKNPNDLNKLTSVRKNAQRMLNLVNQLMTFQKMEEGHDPLKVRKVNINEFLLEIGTLFEDGARMKGIDFKINTTPVDEDVWIDESKIEKILFNLLLNAYKFTPKGGEIWIDKYSDSKYLYIDVCDTGQGIPEEKKEQIFDRFYEKNTVGQENLIKGSGIGLALSKELIELHGGKIMVESILSKGAKFKVIIPLGKAHLKEEDLLDEAENDKDTRSEEARSDFELIQKDYSLLENAPKSLVASDKKLLIVDDNEEVREYIASIFNKDYHLLLAKDGIDGMEKVLQFQPDLIISDLMMPMQDGIEFCKAVKSNIETSHIPFILLTAKNVVEAKIEGLKLGALDYITKPFHPEELKVKVDHIFQFYEVEGNKSLEISGKPKNLEISSLDEEFVQKLYGLTEKNMSNPDFKLEFLAQELNVSRSLLFTKVKHLTNQTPKNYIKHYRMNRAIQMIESGKMTISEISYAVGYKDAKYFSKVFKEDYGKTPTEYAMEFIS